MIDVKVVRIYRFVNDTGGTGALKAFVDISVNDALLIKSVRVIQGKNGLFISMPSDQSKNGKWYETVWFMDNKVKELITKVILDTYNAEPMEPDQPKVYDWRK